MGKETGLGARYALDGIDMSSDSQMFGNIDKSMALLEMPGVDVFAQERYPAQLMGELNWKTYLNPTVAHATLKTMPRTDRIASYFHKATLGVPVANLVTRQFSYGLGREKNGMISGDVKTQSNASWLDWGYALTAWQRTDTAGTNGSSVDFGNPSPGAYNFGLQAYLHVFSFAGTTCTVKLQSSSDNGAGDAFADVTGGAFTAVTSGTPQAQKIATARNQSIERYLRVVTTGTFTSIVFAVSATVNITDMTL